MLNDVLHLDKHLYVFKTSDTKLYSCCNQEDETSIHMFADTDQELFLILNYLLPLFKYYLSTKKSFQI